MALFDLSDVTQTLIFLLEQRIPALDGWPSLVTVGVSPLPPDRMQTLSDTNLGFYLYHLTEDAHHKNITNGEPAQTTLALNLYYQLTAQVGDVETDAYAAQALMGAAVRVLHDYPLITDSTTVTDSNGNVHPVLAQFGLDGRGNRIRINLRPVPVDDGVDYWTAGNAPLRLAAYYQVSVVLLESEPQARAALPVLSYANAVFASGAPVLTGSSATLSIVVGNNASANGVPVQPAQVTVGETFKLEGGSLAGVSTALRLRDARGTRVVDSNLWSVSGSSSVVLARVSATLGDVELLPGSLGASVVVTRAAPGGGGTLTTASNETPIVITPSLDEVSATGPTLGSAAPGATVNWTGWRFAHPDIPVEPPDPQAVYLYVNGELLERNQSTPLQPGQFEVVDAGTLSVRLPDTLVAGSIVPVRVGVRGAFSAPRWLGVA
jgi:hypothetical protein